MQATAGFSRVEASLKPADIPKPDDRSIAASVIIFNYSTQSKVRVTAFFQPA